MRIETNVRFLTIGLIFCTTLCADATRSLAQNSPESATCGGAKVDLANPTYLTTNDGIIAVEPPRGWALDKGKSNPFYFLKDGETYQGARTLIYINVQHLDVPFERAVQNDELDFKQQCQPARVKGSAELQILEQGCQRKTEFFFCDRKRGAYVDLATKISIGGLLLNVVISADNEVEISKYQKDYAYLLQHLALVK